MSKKAHEDEDFLNREELRPVKMQLEMLRPKIIMDENNITSTVPIFGSARIYGDHKMNKWYDKTREVSKLISEYGDSLGNENGKQFVVSTGAGPGIMEAGNRGAHDVGLDSVGLSIRLPFESSTNDYVTEDLDFLFNYFSVRKMHFLIRAKAAVVMPGGFGTFDELFELLTLIQTQRMEPIPIILMGKEFWHDVVGLEKLAEYGVISGEDLNLFHFADKPKKVLKIIKDFYS